MHLTNLNRKDRIGANGLFLEIGPFRILIDAGLDPKAIGREATPDYSLIGEEPLDFIVLTHCHLDHLGSLPIASRHNPQAEVFLSLPSADLAPRMLTNSVNVMKRQREQQSIPEYPLYTFSEIAQLEQKFHPLPFEKTRHFDKGNESIAITLYRAGHIPGAAAVKLEYKHKSLFFTGDVLFRNMKTLPGAHFPKETFDVLVTETTRGDTRRPTDYSFENEVSRLLSGIHNTLEQGGSVLLPVFALGRMHEILFILNEARQKQQLPECPIYCTGLGMALVDHFDRISRKTGLVNFRKKILQDLKVKPLKQDLEPGVQPKKNGIFVLSSGMLVEHTPSYLMAAGLMEHPHNSIYFVGYCDPDTPGGKLLSQHHDADFVFEALDYVAPIRAHIERFDLSGHADREELLNFAIESAPRSIVLTHGDPSARDWFLDELYANPVTSGAKIIDPQPGETCSL